MTERKCFICGCFGQITWHCRNKKEIEKNKKVEVGEPEHWFLSNNFEVLTSIMMQAGISSKKSEKKERLLREVIVKIELKQEDNEDRITVEALLESSMIELVMSLEFVRKNKFKKKKLEML